MSIDLHLEFHNGILSLVEDSTHTPLFQGPLHSGGALSRSTATLSRPALNLQIGTVTWHAASGKLEIQLASGRPVATHRGNILSRKTTVASSQGELTWKGDGLLHSSLKLVDQGGIEIAHLGGLMTISSKNMGKLQLQGLAVKEGELQDEVVLSAVGMLIAEKAKELTGIVGGSIASLS